MNKKGLKRAYDVCENWIIVAIVVICIHFTTAGAAQSSAVLDKGCRRTITAIDR